MHKKILLDEDQVFEYFLLLLEKDKEMFRKMMDATSLDAKREYIEQCLELQEKMNELVEKMGLSDEE
jgi:formiminotetrahydrofolate cyclodeaminase